MIKGTHILFYSKDPEADRAFVRDVLNFRSVDAGGGWLIFGMPPTEAAFHPVEDESVQRHAEHNLLGAIVYLMCDDLPGTMKLLQARGVNFAPVQEAPWGSVTSFPLPSGGEIGLYQPKHPTANGMA